MTEPFRFPDGQLAYNVEDLIRLCQRSPDDGINYLMREDLEKWLAYIGKTDLAQRAKKIREESASSDRERLDKFLAACQPTTTPESKQVEQPSPLQNILQAIRNFLAS
jgi:hypothetical protein